MKLTPNKKAWIISIALHGVILLFLSDVISKEIIEKKQEIQPVNVQLYRAPQPKMNTKRQVARKGTSESVKKSKPTSLPGDRKQPETAQSMVPTYPKLALNNEWEGTVKVNVTVSSTGKPIQVTVISSSGYETLDNSFIRAIQNSYQFKPKRVMGNNVVGVITLSYSFTLGGQK